MGSLADWATTIVVAGADVAATMAAERSDLARTWAGAASAQLLADVLATASCGDCWLMAKRSPLD